MQATEAEDWANTLRERGHSPEEIRALLAKKGVSSKDIDAALAGTTGTKSTLVRTLVVIVVLVIVVILIPYAVKWIFGALGYAE